MRKNVYLGVAAMLCAGLSSNAHAADASAEDKNLIIKEIFSGKQTKFQDYLIQDAATPVTAAALAGIAPGAVQVVENTRDFTGYLKGLDGDSKGAGFAITPARIKNPFPSITVEEYKSSAWARAVAAATLSYAQGTTDTDGKKYKRRAVSIATNWYPGAVPGKPGDVSDDPVYEAIVTGENCLASYVGDHGDDTTKAAGTLKPKPAVGGGAPVPVPGKNTAKLGPDGRPVVLVEPDYELFEQTAGKYITSCSAKNLKAVAARWYRPVVSLSYGTGDVAPDGANNSAVRMGDHLTISMRYGRALSPNDEKIQTESVTGWAVSLSHQMGRNAPVLSTLGSAKVDRQSTHVTAARLSIGQSTWRALLEGSNARQDQAGAGEQTLRKAIGLEYRLGESGWLHVRYGKRQKITGAGEEVAGLLSLTFGPEALQF